MDQQPQAMTLSLPTAEATFNLGFSLGRSLPAGSVVLLEGELGSGKTTFVQGLGRGIGIIEPIDSPTFTLINEYTEGRLPLYHLDLYRLQPAEAAALHPHTYWEGVEAPLGIVAIEWADRLQSKPSSYLQIHFSYRVESGRRADLFAVGELQLNTLADSWKLA